MTPLICRSSPTTPSRAPAPEYPPARASARFTLSPAWLLRRHPASLPIDGDEEQEGENGSSWRRAQEKGEAATLHGHRRWRVEADGGRLDLVPHRAQVPPAAWLSVAIDACGAAVPFSVWEGGLAAGLAAGSHGAQ